MSTAMRQPSFTSACTCRIAWCASRPGRKPKLDSEKPGSKIGVSTWATSLLDHTICHRGDAQQPPATVGLGDFHPSHRLRPVAPCVELLSYAGPVCACMGGPVLHGHAVNARRSLVGLDPLPRTLPKLSLSSTAWSKSSVSPVLPSSCLKAGCVPIAGASSPVGVAGAFEVCMGCSLCLVVRPFGRPTPGGLLWRLLTSAPSRRALPRVALCAGGEVLPVHRTRRAARRGAWDLDNPVWPDPEMSPQARRSRRRSPGGRVSFRQICMN